jgi:predicted anti-sigma-YlaC factor YlaD
MQCEHAHELYSDYVAGHLDRALIVTIDNHLSQCTACREELAGLRRVWANLDGMPAVDPPPFFHENLMHRLNAELSSQEEAAERRRAVWDWRALFRPRAMAFAATLLIVVFAGAGLVHTQSAGLWPFSLFANHTAPTHPAPPSLRKPDVEWMPNAATGVGGTLTIHLQLNNAAATQMPIQYTVSLENVQPTDAKAVSGVFARTGTATVELPLPAQPDENKDTLVITVKSERDGAVQSEVWRQQLQMH